MYEKDETMHDYAIKIGPMIMELKTTFMEVGFSEEEAFQLAKSFFEHTLKMMG